MTQRLSVNGLPTPVPWTPVLLSRELRRTQRRRVSVQGRRFAIFRTGSGGVGALPDQCPHRRAPLSEGRVSGEHLVCPYHGWRFATDGAVTRAGAPSETHCTSVLRCREADGLIWIADSLGAAEPPSLAMPGTVPIGTLRMSIASPLALVLDNLTEMEHCAEAHLLFGYDAAGLAQVTVSVTSSETSVRVVARGPQRRLPAPARWMWRCLGGAADDMFVDEMVVEYAPVRIASESYWESAATGERRRDAVRAQVVLTPVSAGVTDLFAIYALAHGCTPVARWARPLLWRIIRLELERDRRVAAMVAAADPSLTGMELSRFDAPVQEVRRKLAVVDVRTDYGAGPPGLASVSAGPARETNSLTPTGA
jgi:nitrite reductase/ring-hydroxylating ferredoxin subunit